MRRRIDDETHGEQLDALLHLSQALETDGPAAKLRIDLVTRGAQPVGRDCSRNAVAQAPGDRLDARDPRTNTPNFSCRGIDLPFESSAADAALLWSELLRKDAEREIAFRGEARYVQRLGSRPALRASNGSIPPCRCVSNPASAGISIRCVSRHSRCRPAVPAKC